MSSKTVEDQSTRRRRRLVSIDAARGLVMLLMLLDHVRETVYLHLQVGDPVDVTTTSPALVFLRFLSSLCAPTFVLLTGMGAYFYSQRHTKKETSSFLLKRGLILILLEIIVINFAWTGVFPPTKVFLQIIWCIGICMVALAGLIHLPRLVQITLSIVIIGAHNLLGGVTLAESHPLHLPWAVLYQRDWIDFFGIPARTSYPVLPWIGIILGGFLLASWFTSSATKQQLTQRFVRLSCVLLVLFFVLRGLNFYGDQPWTSYEAFSLTFMEFFTLTKYPPSLLFTLLTLAIAVAALASFERWENRTWVQKLAEFGSGAMFFYICHLYLLKGVYLILVALYGTNKGQYYGVDHPYQIVLWALVLSIPLWFLTIWYVRFKKRHRELKWLSYF